MVVPILLVLAALILLVLEVLVVSLGTLSLAAAACATVGIVLGFQEPVKELVKHGILFSTD